MHKTIVAAALLTVAGVCLAQPPGITREMIMQIAKDLGYTVTQENLPREMLYKFMKDNGIPTDACGARTVQGHLRRCVRLPRPSRVSPDDAGRGSEEGHVARDGVGQRRLRD